jgi:hypothetical protein
MAYDPYEVLGVPHGSSQDDIKRAYHERAKRCHPDIHGDGSAEQFIRVQEAYEKLRERAGVRVHEGTADDAGLDGDAGDDLDPVAFVRGFMERKRVEILFTGAMNVRGAPRMALSHADIDAYLDRLEADREWLIDEVMLTIKRDGVKFAKSDIERALRVIMREDKKSRKNSILRPLLKAALSEEENARAVREWHRLADGAFEMDTALAVAILQKFIYQVKRKTLGLPIQRHLMPVILSVIQGIGKTKFVLRFLAPIQELATPPALLSDFIDKRSGDLYSYPAVFIDDLEKIEPRLIPTLNALVTGETLARRILGTSQLGHRQQLATLIGTANKEIAELIEDETGNRRFATMRLRNGEVKKGGDPNVWDVIDSTDYDLLWRSVDAFASDPIDPFLEQLFALQESTRKLSDLEAWLLELDLASEAVKAITTPNGVKADMLRGLFNAQTGSDMTMSKFGTHMLSYFTKSNLPFSGKITDSVGTLYVVRQP